MRARQLFALDEKPDWRKVDAYNRQVVTLFLDGCRTPRESGKGAR
jgi:hypothetical protein